MKVEPTGDSVALHSISHPRPSFWKWLRSIFKGRPKFNEANLDLIILDEASGMPEKAWYLINPPVLRDHSVIRRPASIIYSEGDGV